MDEDVASQLHITRIPLQSHEQYTVSSTAGADTNLEANALQQMVSIQAAVTEMFRRFFLSLEQEMEAAGGKRQRFLMKADVRTPPGARRGGPHLRFLHAAPSDIVLFGRAHYFALIVQECICSSDLCVLCCFPSCSGGQGGGRRCSSTYLHVGDVQQLCTEFVCGSREMTK